MLEILANPGKLGKWEYHARVLSVYDGDTFTADVSLPVGITFEPPADLGFHVYVDQIQARVRFGKIKFRMAGIQAPELGDPGAIEARDALRGWISGREVELHTIRDEQEKYGRWLARVLIPDLAPMTVNDWMVANGHARPYMV